jgi:hypothetical protein
MRPYRVFGFGILLFQGPQRGVGNRLPITVVQKIIASELHDTTARCQRANYRKKA